MHRARRVSLGRFATGERLGGFIYGTIVALAVVVAGAKAYPHNAGLIALLVGVTAVAFWIAHVYAQGLAQSIAQDHHLSLAELRDIARREASIIEATLPPLAGLLLGAFGVVSTRAATWMAFGLGLVVLAAEGIAVARVERLGWIGTLAVTAANLSFGVLLVGVKLLVIH